MKPTHADELGLLVSSYAWAAREGISPLAELLDIVVSGTALYIGSGGALAVSALAAALHVPPRRAGVVSPSGGKRCRIMQLRAHRSFDNRLDITRPVEHALDESGTGHCAEAYDPAAGRFPYCVALLGVGGTPVRRCWAIGHNVCLRALCPQVLQQRLGLLEVGGVKSLGKPAIDL